MTDPRLLLLSPGDTVYVLRDQIAAGEAVMVEGRGGGHSAARWGWGTRSRGWRWPPGDKVMKYGAPIGSGQPRHCGGRSCASAQSAKRLYRPPTPLTAALRPD